MSVIIPADKSDVFTALLGHPSASGSGLLGGPGWNAELALDVAFDALSLMRRGSTMIVCYGSHRGVAYFWK